MKQQRLFDPQVPPSRVGSLRCDDDLLLLLLQFLGFRHRLEFQSERGEVKRVASAAGRSRRQVRRVDCGRLEHCTAVAGQRVDLMEL